MRPGLGPGGGWRAWSMTTWIIVFCVAVFVIDALLPERWVSMTPETNPIAEEVGVDLREIDRSQWIIQDDTVAVGPRGQTRQLRIDAEVNGVLVKGVGVLPQQRMHMLESWLHFSTQRGFLEFQFWRLIGFQFLHSHFSIGHLLFNMIGLFVFGPIVEARLGRKRFLAFYLICGIFGALMYVTLNILGITSTLAFGLTGLPFLLPHDPTVPLIGASAGVFGVIFGAAAIAPRERVLLFGLVPITIRLLAWGVFALAFLNLMTLGNNAGGEAAHVGGALAGHFFIRRSHLLHDFFDLLGRVDPTSSQYRGRRISASRSRGDLSGDRLDAEVDKILAKVKSSGVQSLTKKEQDLLARATKRDG